MNKLITIKGLKAAVLNLNKDVMSLEGNSMMKVSDVISAFKKELERVTLEEFSKGEQDA